jgi:hypothetical protein
MTSRILKVRYLATKREAEMAVLALPQPVRGVVFRPGFMFSHHEPATMVIGALLLGAGAAVKKLQLGHIARAITGVSAVLLLPFFRAHTRTLPRTTTHAHHHPGYLSSGAIY